MDDPRLREILATEAYASTLLILAMDHWPPDPVKKHQGCLEWTRQTLKMEFEQAIAPLSDGNLDRLMAAITIVTTDRFFQDAETFIRLCNILFGSDIDPTVFEPADVFECAWGITEGLLLSQDDNPSPFSEDVRVVVRHALDDEGFVEAPDVLRIAAAGTTTSALASDWTDDPEMFSGIYEVQQGRAGDVTAMLRENLTELSAQLKLLTLTHGSVKEFEGQVKAMLAKSQPTEPGEL